MTISAFGQESTGGDDPAGSRSVAVLETRSIRKTFAGREVLRGLDCAIYPAEKVCILGPSGSGKTTFLKCLNLLIEPNGGELWFKQERVGAWPCKGQLSPKKLCTFRSNIGMVFQQFELFSHLTALSNTMLGPRYVRGESREVCEERGLKYLTKVGLRNAPMLIRGPCRVAKSSVWQSPEHWLCSQR